MKNIAVEKAIISVILAIVVITVVFLYKKGEISFLPNRKIEKGQLARNVSFVPFTEKEYRLSYANSLPDNASLEIARFEEDEGWQSDGELDYATVFEGDSSLFLISRDGKRSQAVLKLENPFDFQTMRNYKLMINFISNPEDLESFKLTFVGADGREYRYFVNNFDAGWHLLVMPRDRFSLKNPTDRVEKTKIIDIRLELVSRPKTNSSIYIDSLWAETTDDYQRDWSTGSSRVVSLSKVNGQLGLMLVKPEGYSVAINKITSAKNYEISAKFTPIKKGNFGLFLRGDAERSFGYYMMLDGIGSSNWQISKYGIFDKTAKFITLDRGFISNLEIENKGSYWLKTKLFGSKISLYISTDGINYTKLGETNDNSFSAGNVGIATNNGGVFLVDDLHFSQ